MGDQEASNAGPALVAVSIGNSAITCARAAGKELGPMRRVLHEDLADAASAILDAAQDPAGCDAVVIASVNDPVRDALMDQLIPTLDVELYRVGDDLVIPIAHTLTDAAIASTGRDRLLNALAAHELTGAAAMVVDAGSAITVDFVDGAGTFHGGAIAVGARMALRALHEYTVPLPGVELAAPSPEPYGADTAQAMLQGVYYGAQGLVHRLLERYAESAGFYPPVVATGGDAALLFDHDPIVERIVPDLTLRGIAAACRDALAREHD